MRFDLKRACKHCPFIKQGEGRMPIRFATRSRAEEVDELGYREGFPCHQSAECVEPEDECSGSFEFKEDGSTQHCVGFLSMYLQRGDETVPYQALSQEEQDKIAENIDWPWAYKNVYYGQDEFIRSYPEEE